MVLLLLTWMYMEMYMVDVNVDGYVDEVLLMFMLALILMADVDGGW